MTTICLRIELAGTSTSYLRSLHPPVPLAHRARHAPPYQSLALLTPWWLY